MAVGLRVLLPMIVDVGFRPKGLLLEHNHGGISLIYNLSRQMRLPLLFWPLVVFVIMQP